MLRDDAAAALFGAVKHGWWTEVGRDPSGRRVAVVCVCGTSRTMSVEALDGGSTSCGCKAPSKQQQQARLAEAADMARRAVVRDWRPGG